VNNKINSIPNDKKPAKRVVSSEKDRTIKKAPSTNYSQLKPEQDYFLLSTVYDAPSNGAGVKLFDVKAKRLVYITDPYGHEPYCYSREKIDDIKSVQFPKGIVKAIERVTKIDLLNDKEIELTQIITPTPSEVPRVRDILEETAKTKAIIGETWESRIKYHRNWIYDVQLVPGRKYWWDPQEKKFLPSQSRSLGMNIPKEVMMGLTKYKGLTNEFHDDFTQEIPEIPIVACDIETEYEEGQIPQATDPKFQITCVCFADNQDNEIALVLQRKGIEKGIQPKELSPTIKIENYSSEKDLLKRTFEILKKYPIVTSFNGDNFDFPYLHERARRLKVHHLSPIKWNRRDNSCNLGNTSIHLDLYRFYRNVAIKTYAFGNKYKDEKLDSIAHALLGKGKVELDKGMAELSEWELIYYCSRDAKITLDLLLFDNSTPLNLIFILSRISRTPIDDLVRTSVSNWVRSLFYYEHRRRNYLIPNPEDIQIAKGTQGGTKAIIKGKKYKGATVIDPIPGIHFNVAVLDFSSLYPSIIGTFNLSYETILCNHEECKKNSVPQTNYWVCTQKRGIMADIVGFIKDVRVQWLKPESKKASEKKTFYQILERSLKVLINACLPYDEEVIVKNHETGIITNRKIGSLKKDWQEFDVLSIDRRNSIEFGKPTFVSIKRFSERQMSTVLTFSLADGRVFRCTPNHVIPKVKPYNYSKKQLKLSENIIETPAGDLNVGDDVLVVHNIPLIRTPYDRLFIPEFIDCNSYWVGVRREDYKKFSYKVNEKTSNKFINIINSKFRYSKSSKMYKTSWNNLSSNEKLAIEKETCIPVFLKIDIKVGRWYPLHVLLNDDFFSLLGWFVSDGSISKNRFSISQSKEKHPKFWNEIKDLLDRLNLSYYSNDRGFGIHSNVFSLLLESLCGRGAINKRIPIQLFDIPRANKFLDSYFKGDGGWEKDRRSLNKNRLSKEENPINESLRRSFSTISPQLKNELLILLGATGNYTSVQSDLTENNWQKNLRYRILETKGRHYRRKFKGLLDFNGTTPVKIKSISNSVENQSVYDLTTGNDWFVSTNGVVVHNSYGVIGSDRFQLYCLPVADSTTAYGRNAIEKTIQKSKSLDIQVLYGDTDSVFLLNPSKEQIDEIIQWSQRDLGVGLEMEKIYRYVVLSERKKNYLGVFPDSSIDVKGLMGKKRNTPPFLQEGFKRVLQILSHVNTPEEFEKAKKEVKNLVRSIYQKLEKKHYSAAELTITMQLSQSLSSYKVKSQHFKAATQLEEHYQKMYMKTHENQRRKSPFIKAGQLIQFVKTKSGDRVIPLELMTDISQIDIKSYKSMIDSIFDQLFGALDIGVEEVATSQVNLMEFFG